MGAARRRERGAALIEFAIVLPLLTMLAITGLEIGLAWVARNATGNAARAAGITAVTTLLDRDVDARILRAVINDVEIRGQGQVRRVIVYRATTTEAGPPAACLALTPAWSDGINGRCNVYGPDAFTAVGTGAGLDGFIGPCDGARDRFWCPVDRSHDSSEMMGIHVEVGHTSALGLVPFVDGMTLRSSATVSNSEFGYNGVPDTPVTPPDPPCDDDDDDDCDEGDD